MVMITKNPVNKRELNHEMPLVAFILPQIKGTKMAFKASIALCIILATICYADQKRDRIFKTYACEGRTLSLSCGGDRIFIINADYGRWNASVCPYYDDSDMDLNCYQPHALDKVVHKCERKSSCKFIANNELFSNPCPGQIKYAEVYYTCISRFAMMGYTVLTKKDLDELRQKMLTLMNN